MTNNENNNKAGSRSWNSPQSLGFSVLQRHKNTLSQPVVRNHLGLNRITLAADIYRRYNRSNSSVIGGANFPFVNLFAQTSLHSNNGDRIFLSQSESLGMNAIHRMGNLSPYIPPIGIKRELIGVNMHRRAISLTANENSSMSASPSNSSDQRSIVSSNATTLSRMPYSSNLQTHISEQASIRRRTEAMGEKSSFNNSIETNTSRGHSTGLIQRVAGRQNRKGSFLNPALDSAIARFAPLEHYDSDSKTAPRTDAVSRVFATIAHNAESSESAFEMVARQQQILSGTAQPGNNRAQSTVQRAVSRQNNVFNDSRDNNVVNGEPARFNSNKLWTGHTAHFSSPPVTANPKFSLSSGKRFEGLGLGRKIVDRSAGTLSQQEFAADFMPARSITKFAPQKHDYPESKTVPMADAVSQIPSVSPKAEPSSEKITRQQISFESPQLGNNHAQSSMQRAIRRQNNVFHEPRGNNEVRRNQVQFFGNQPGTGHADHFSSPLITINRKFSLSSGNRFEGLGLGRKIAERTLGTLSQQGFAADFILASAIAKLAPLEHSYPVSKTAPIVNSASGFPAISPKAEPSSEMKAWKQQISPEAAVSLRDNRSQSSVQRAVSRQNGVFPQNQYQHHENNVVTGDPLRFAGNELWTGRTAHFASPLIPVMRKFSLSLGNRFEGLGLGRKIADRTVGTLSQQGYAEDFIPASAVARFAPLEHYKPDSKTASKADDVSGVPVISRKAEPSSGIIARQQQISSDTAQSETNHSQSSVQRAVDRQNSSLSQITTKPGTWDKVSELVSAKRENVYQLNTSTLADNQEHQHDYPMIPSNSINRKSGTPIDSNNISSLLMRSTIISPVKRTNQVQASSGQQQLSISSPLRRAVARKNDYMLRNNSIRPIETGDLNALTWLSRSNLTSSRMKSIMPGTTPTSPIEQKSPFSSDHAMDRTMHLPLSQPFVVQRKTVLSGDHVAGDGSDYLQRQEVNNTGALPPPATLMQTGETAGSVTGKPDSNASSTDDVVEKVWRKLMRKLTLEQERMGGSNRWAS